MASCIPYTQWIAANAACQAKTNPISVKGFGYVPTGMAALRGLGFSVSASITPTSVANAIQSGQLINPPPSAPPVIQSTPTINTTPMVDPNDPCYIASQNACPAGTGCPAVCPTGFHSIDLLVAPGQPPMCNCTRDRAPVINYGNAFMARGVPNSPSSPTITPGFQQASASASGGFQHWGILAAVVLGGGALYYVTRKKRAA